MRFGQQPAEMLLGLAIWVGLWAALVSGQFPWKPFPLEGPRYTWDQWMQTCNSSQRAWLVNHVLWQKDHKYDPDTKYLGYSCFKRPHQFKTGEYVCQGLGDRTRGTMFLWRLAALTGRALIINQTHPAPLEMFLKPTGIVDWLPDPRIRHPNGAEKYDQHQVMWPKVKNGTFSDIKDPLILWETNEHEFSDFPGMPKLGLQGFDRDMDLHCMWHALYQPTNDALQYAKRHYDQLKITPDKPYGVIHLRMGGSVGESQDLFKSHWENALPMVLSAVRAAQALLTQQGNAGAPVVLVTDHAILRHFVAMGAIGNVSAYKTIPHHFDAGHDGLDGPMETIADLVIMGHASVQVMGTRGFSNMGRWWAGPVPFEDVHYVHQRFWNLNAWQQAGRRLMSTQHRRRLSQQRGQVHRHVDGSIDTSSTRQEQAVGSMLRGAGQQEEVRRVAGGSLLRRMSRKLFTSGASAGSSHSTATNQVQAKADIITQYESDLDLQISQHSDQTWECLAALRSWFDEGSAAQAAKDWQSVSDIIRSAPECQEHEMHGVRQLLMSMTTDDPQS